MNFLFFVGRMLGLVLNGMKDRYLNGIFIFCRKDVRFHDEKDEDYINEWIKYGGISKDSFLRGRLVSFLNKFKEKSRYW